MIIDRKYIGFISNRLRNFQHKGNGLSSFTHDCERKESRKRRGYFLHGKEGIIMKCHNCGVCMSLGNFLKELDPYLAKEYRLECFKEGVYGDNKTIDLQEDVEPKPERVTSLDISGLISYTNIPETHPAMRYLTRRMIPRDKIHGLYIAPNFHDWAKRFEPVFEKFKTDHPRLVIPYFGLNNQLLGFACRAFGKEEPKYIQLRLDKEKEFLYGIDSVDTTKKFIAIEGQIDSMFLKNCIAVGNANYGAKFLHDHKDNAIIVPDNDFRRNPDVCAQLKRAIDNGFTISLLPEQWPKDINDCVKSGIPAQEIEDYIYNHARSGPAAVLEYTLEKRC